MVEKIIVGRDRPDLEKYGEKGTVFIGKHIVGQGEESHLTNPVLMDVSGPHIVLVCGKRGSGKCLEGNTLIALEDGSNIPIKDLELNQKRVIGLNRDLKINTLRSTNFYKRKVKTLIHVKTRSGKEIKLTPEHPLLTIKGWKEVNDLKIGSRIATPRKIISSGEGSLEKNKIKLLAYFLAEGHIKNFTLFSNSDDKICQDFFNCVHTFDPELIIKEHSKRGCYRVVKKKREVNTEGALRDKSGKFIKGSTVSPKKSSLAEWLMKMGIHGKLSKERVIPDIVFG